MKQYSRTIALKLVLTEMWNMNKSIIISIPIIVLSIFIIAGFWSNAPFFDQFIFRKSVPNDQFYEKIINHSNQLGIFSVLCIPAYMMLTLKGYLIHLNTSYQTSVLPIKPSDRVVGICIFSMFTYLSTIVSIILIDNMFISLNKYLYLADTITYLESKGEFYYQFKEYTIFNGIQPNQLFVFTTAILLIIPFYTLFVYMLRQYATTAFIILGIGMYIILMTYHKPMNYMSMNYPIDGWIVTSWKIINYLIFIYLVLLSFYYKLKEKEH